MSQFVPSVLYNLTLCKKIKKDYEWILRYIENDQFWPKFDLFIQILGQLSFFVKNLTLILAFVDAWLDAKNQKKIMSYSITVALRNNIMMVELEFMNRFIWFFWQSRKFKHFTYKNSMEIIPMHTSCKNSFFTTVIISKMIENLWN